MSNFLTVCNQKITINMINMINDRLHMFVVYELNGFVCVCGHDGSILMYKTTWYNNFVTVNNHKITVDDIIR